MWTKILPACLLTVSAAQAQVPASIQTAANQYVAAASKMDPALGIPRATQRDGSWAFSHLNYWTTGFYSGTLWYLAGATHRADLAKQAERWTLPLANIPFGSFSHDLGFQFNQSFMNAYKVTAEEKYRGPALNAARLLALRFSPVVGAIKSWDWMPPERPYPVIADNMMNLELLFWGARQSDGDKRWYDVAVQHARTTLREHVRPDGSSYHVIVFDPRDGKVLDRITWQGHANNSTWARGEAWLVYGFTMAFRETGNREFLDGARKVSEYFITHLPTDAIPCWDFNAPGCPESAKRDASAAAIAASGLLELSRYVDRTTSDRYRSTADKILATLSSAEYRTAANAPALLKHSVGNMPGNSEIDVGIVYADYYYVEAMLRQAQMNGDTTIHVMPARMPITYTARADQLRKSKERYNRGDAATKAPLATLIKDAESAMKVGPFTVMTKQRVPPSGDKHDYVSYAPYWWPDSTKPNGLPFIRRDGEVNQETRRDSDVLRWYAFNDAFETLAQAYYFTDDVRYSDRAALLLRTWFLDPATRMNPNLNYGQAIPGVVEGRGIGLIDLRDFGRTLDAVSLIEASPSWSDADDKALRAWLTEYTNWLKTSKNGVDEAGEKNNHGTWYDVQLAALQLFLGDTVGARTVFEGAKEKRIAAQIDSIGRQPLELARTRSLHYSVENLEGMTRLAEMARAVNVDLWGWKAPNGASIRKAIDFVAPYADTTMKWPEKQITKEPDDLFVPLLLRTRLPLKGFEAHRARLLYPLSHPPAPCEAECLALAQVISNGRRTGWAEQGRWYNTKESVAALQKLIAVPKPDERVRAAVNGGIAWLKDGALYKGATGPFWAERYDVNTSAPVDTSKVTKEPSSLFASYEKWRSRRVPSVVATTVTAVVDANYRGPQGGLVDGVKTFNTIGRALVAAPANAIYNVKVRNGRYNERIVVESPNVHLTGQSRDSTVVFYDVAAGYKSPTGGTFGTRGSWVLRVAAPGFHLENMTVENTFDYMTNYRKVNEDSTKLRDSQGLAVMLDYGSDRAVFKNCGMVGHQDTFYPNAGRTYVKGCTISGSVDFIFGAGQVVFDSVDVVSRDRGSKSNNGYITAPSTSRSQQYGLVFINSRLKKEANMNAGTVSLGRPWHPSSDPDAVGSAVFINTWMDDHINGEGWVSMNSTDALGVRITNKPEDARFFEYKSSGPGAVKSATRRVLSASEASRYTILKVLSGWDPRK